MGLEAFPLWLGVYTLLHSSVPEGSAGDSGRAALTDATLQTSAV